MVITLVRFSGYGDSGGGGASLPADGTRALTGGTCNIEKVKGKR